MTNEQLAVLLNLYRERMETEIDYIRDCLDGNSDNVHERHNELWNTKKNSKARLFLFGWWVDGDHVPDGYEERLTGDFVILEGLKALLDQMEYSIETLGGTE